MPKVRGSTGSPAMRIVAAPPDAAFRDMIPAMMQAVAPRNAAIKGTMSAAGPGLLGMVAA